MLILNHEWLTKIGICFSWTNTFWYFSPLISCKWFHSTGNTV